VNASRGPRDGRVRTAPDRSGPLGLDRSKGAPRQGYEGAPDASIEIHPEFQRGLDGVKAGDDVLVLTCVTVTRIDGGRLDVRPLEAIDGTPVVDIKPVLEQSNDM
jgi:L-fuculose-phosphate aldolase